MFKERGIDLDKDLWESTNEVYQKAISDGMNISANIDYKDNRFAVMQKMKRNVATFAAFKNHDNITKLVEALEDNDGKLRSFSAFKREAKKINATYNEDWLQAEYDTATRSSKMARKWAQYEEDADVYPNLKYLTQQDDRVRNSHKVLHGIVKPINDPFWDEYFPPNGWRCRCDTSQTDEDVSTSAAVPRPEDVPEAFRHNSGKDGDVFNQQHPFFNNVVPSEGQKVIQSMRSYSVRSESSYTTIVSKGGNSISSHYDVSESEIELHMNVARALYEMKNSVKLLPNYAQPESIKWPDIFLNNKVLLEVKKITTRNQDGLLDQALNASKQLKNNVYTFEKGYVILEVEQFTEGELKRFLLRYFGKSSRDKIYLYKNNSLYEFNRGEWFTF